jgi:hypothetical protein
VFPRKTEKSVSDAIKSEIYTLNVRIEGYRDHANLTMAKSKIPFIFESDHDGTAVGRVPESFRHKIADLYHKAYHGRRPYLLGSIVDYWPREGSQLPTPQASEETHKVEVSEAPIGLRPGSKNHAIYEATICDSEPTLHGGASRW